MSKILLYVHHVGSYGGSTNSLLDMISHTKVNDKRYLITPRGAASKSFEEAFDKVFYVLGIPQLDNTEFGYYRGLRWIILIREIIYFLTSIPFFLNILFKNFLDIRLIHFNEITLAPLALVAKFLGFKIIFHVRSLQRKNFRSKLFFILFRKTNYIPIDEYVSHTLPEKINKTICRNSYNNSNKKKIIKSNKSIENIVILGGDPYQKGIDLAIKAVESLRNDGFLNLNISIFGMPNVSSLKNYIHKIISPSKIKSFEFIKKAESYNWVKFYSFTNNRENIFFNKDLLLFTSRLNAPGRPVIEASSYFIPSIYCSNLLINGCFNNVSIVCNPNIEKIKSSILKVMQKISYKDDYKYYKKINELHSSNAQAKILSSIYGVMVCKK